MLCGLARWEIIQGITRVSIDADFKMQQGLIAVVPAHFGNLPAGRHPITFRDQPLFIVCIGAQHPIAVFDDDEFTVANQAITAVNHLTSSRCNDRLAFVAGNFNTVAGGIIFLEIADDPTVGGP